jgi:hypothetical protein
VIGFHHYKGSKTQFIIDHYRFLSHSFCDFFFKGSIGFERAHKNGTIEIAFPEEEGKEKLILYVDYASA